MLELVPETIIFKNSHVMNLNLRIRPILLASVLIAALGFGAAAYAQIFTQSQVIGFNDLVVDQNGYGGSYSNIQFNPDRSCCANNALTGVSDAEFGQGNRFIESGSTHFVCSVFGTLCELHPYMSFQDVNGNPGGIIRSDITLADGGNYIYYVYFNQGTSWAAFFQDGNGTITLGNPDLGSDIAMGAAGAGGESRTQSAPIGSGQTLYNSYRPCGSVNWTPFCYNHAFVNLGGSLGQCSGAPNYSWSFSK